MEACMHCKTNTKKENTVRISKAINNSNMGKIIWTFCQVSFCIIAVTWLGASKPTMEVIQLHINTSKALIKTNNKDILPDP